MSAEAASVWVVVHETKGCTTKPHILRQDSEIVTLLYFDYLLMLFMAPSMSTPALTHDIARRYRSDQLLSFCQQCLNSTSYGKSGICPGAIGVLDFSIYLPS